jgi:large subunit ribosomal protein L33
MAKDKGKSKKKFLVKLVSTAKTGYFYVKMRNPKRLTEKLAFRKYDPVARKHVLFKEHKLTS